MEPRRTRNPLDAALGLLVTHLCWAAVACAQRSLVSFGPTVEFSTPHPPSTVAVFTPRRAPMPVIVAALADRPGLNTLHLTPAGRIVFDGTIPTNVVPGMVAPVDVNGDGVDELVVLSSDGSQVEIVWPGSEARGSTVIRLEHRAHRFVAADITNDGRKDLLLFGRSMAGVATLLAKGAGRFDPGPLLFPDLSASDLVAADLNGDRITDIVLLHWLSNSFVVHFGIGKGAFSEQVSLSLPDEPRRIAFMPVQGRRTLRFLVTLPERNAVAHIVGTPAGELALREVIPVPGQPLAVSFSLINDDLLPDLVTSTTAGLCVALGASATTFYPLDVFGAGAESLSWSLADVDGDRKTDLVIADRKQSKVVVLGNALHSGPVVWAREYAAGVKPGAMTIGDCTGDGVPDLVVANTGSSGVSIYPGAADGLVLGQRTIAVPEKPESVTIVEPGSSASTTLITVHPSVQQLAIVRPAGGFARRRLITLPTGPRAALLHAEVGTSDQRLHILVRSAQNGGSHAPLAAYEEISGQRFLERGYHFTLPTTISAMTVGGFAGGEERDLVLALRDRATGVTTVSLATAKEGYDFRKIQQLFVLSDSAATVRYLRAGKLNRDTNLDLLLFLSHPRPAMACAFSTPDGQLVLDSARTNGVNPGREDAIALVDCDDDGDTDIVYLDEERDGIYCLDGSREGRFAGPRLLLRAQGARHFAIGRLGPDSRPVIVLSHAARHTVSIHAGAFVP